MTETATINVWQCIACASYNDLSEKDCYYCHKARRDKWSFLQIGYFTPAAKEILERLAKKAKGIKKGNGGKRTTDKPKYELKKLYKTVQWDSFSREYSLTVFGTPIAKERPRLGRGKTYTPKKTKDYEKLIAETARTALHGLSPLNGLVQLSLIIQRQINRLRKDYTWIQKR